MASLTAAEWSVMERLWDDAPKTAMALASELHETVGWAKSTSMTMLSRMEKKGVIRSEDGTGRARLYYPVVERQSAEREETRSFIDRVYGGSVGLMVNAMAARRELSAEDVEELYEILGRMKNG